MKDDVEIVRASHAGVLRFGDVSVPCYVLPDGTAILTTRGILGIFTGVNTGNLDRFVARIPGVSSEIPPESEIKFRLPNANPIANGHRAEVLIDICNRYVAALAAGTLHPKQVPLAVRAAVVVGACAKAGIEAVIWEASGYDRVKAEGALQDTLAKALRTEAGHYRVLFSRGFFAALARLFRVELRPDGRRPMVFAAFLAEFFYSWFGEDIYDEIKTRNPRKPELKGERKYLHHQWLTESARARFEQHQRDVMLLLNTSSSLDDFRMRFNAALRGGGLQLSFDDLPPKKPRR